MRFLTTAACVLIALAAVVFEARAQESFRVSPAQGKAPLAVSVSGPQPLMKLIASCKHKIGWITPGFSIDWDDGQMSPPAFKPEDDGKSCANSGTHVYQVPGTYKVKARIYHLGPTDAPVTDWEGSTQVTVLGENAHAAPNLRITNIREGQTFSYQALPHVQWEIATTKKVDVRGELLTQNGAVIATAIKKGVAYNGQGQLHLSQASDAYDAALRKGQTRFTVVLSAVEQGRVLSQTKVQINASPEWANSSRNWTLTPESGEAPLTVQLNYPYFHPDCFSYQVQWGDKKTDEKRMPVQQQCPLNSGTLKLTHIYQRPGTYTILIKTNGIYPFKSLNDIVHYESATVTVTP